MQHFLLQHKFIEIVRKYPDKIALIVSGKTYVYSEIYQDILRWQHYFLSKKLLRSDRVLILSGNCYKSIIAFYAALFCDAVPAMVDETSSETTLLYFINNLKPHLIVFSNKKQEIALSSFSDLFVDEALIVNFDSKKPYVFMNTETDLAMIMHTSGSTAQPKGVMLSHRNVVAAMNAIADYLGLIHDDVILSVLPLHFDYGLYQILLGFAEGATIVLYQNTIMMPAIVEAISRYNISIIPCLPALIQLFFSYSEHHPFSVQSVRMITNTGERLTLKHIEMLSTLFPRARIFSMFGLTECKRCSYIPPDQLMKKYASIGIPMPNLEMWVADDMGNTLPEFQEGELIISGPTVMMGYWNDPENTAKKIKILSDGRRVLMTGDRCFVDKEGFFYFRGRKDGVIKFKGQKLSLYDTILALHKISGVFRAHAFLKEAYLLICLETNSDTVDLKKFIFGLFHETQKPSHLYFSRKFPSLSNKKIDIASLEKDAIQDFLSSASLSLCI